MIIEQKPKLSDLVSDKFDHFGVLGMRWGVRKGRSSSARKASRTRKANARKEKRSKLFEKTMNAYGITKTKSGKWAVTNPAQAAFRGAATVFLAKGIIRRGKVLASKLAYDPGTMGAFTRGLAWATGRVVENNPL